MEGSELKMSVPQVPEAIISYLSSHPGNSFILQNWKWPNHISKDQLATQNLYFLVRLHLIPVHGLPYLISCSTRFPSLLVCLSLNQHCMSLTLTDVFIVVYPPHLLTHG